VTDHRAFYAARAADYDRLVAAEDCDRHLGPALAARLPIAGARLLEVGAGTGRVTRLLARAGARVVAFDRSPAMLAIARAQVDREGLAVALALADAAALPVAGGWADGAIAGWVFGHFRSWLPGGWRAAVGGALDQMARACAPGAPLVVIETLGTGRREPAPPTPELAEYYRWLEDERGFARAAIRTDYAFAGVDEAAAVTGAFFGDDFAARVRAERWSRVPECTGIWSR
jgi:ubiquinone/menaquinone biosynthesis C-methylase UbiE